MKWEYLVQENSSDYMRNDPYPKAPLNLFLKSIGEDGWELVSAQFLDNGLTGLVSNFLVIAKRPVMEIPSRPNPKWLEQEQVPITTPEPQTLFAEDASSVQSTKDSSTPRKDLILELRRRTGQSVTTCFQALQQTGGDIDAAQQIIKRDFRS
jgi:hypothetical protein